MKVMLKKVLNMVKIAVEVVLVMGFIFFEQLIWERIVIPIRDIMVGMQIFQRLQMKIEAQGTYQTLVIFLVPLGIAEIMGIYSGALIIQGVIVWGAIIYALKIPVAGLTFWMFGFSKPKLLTISWFATLYELLIQGFDWIKSTGIYKSVIIKATDAKAYIKSLIPTESVIQAEFKKIYTKVKDVFVEHDIETETETTNISLRKDEMNVQAAKSAPKTAFNDDGSEKPKKKKVKKAEEK